MELLTISLLVIILCLIIKNQGEPDTITVSYSLVNREIERLANYYIDAHILPKKMIPDNKFTKEELQSYRNECIKFVLETLNNSPMNKLKDKVYTDEYVSYIVDSIFIKKVSML